MIALEDNFADVISKAQRGLALSDEQVTAQSGISTADLSRLKAGEFDEALASRLAPVLQLAPEALVALGRKAWRPRELGEFEGLRQFNTPYEDMTVNAYLVWDPRTREAALFDTGADASPMLASVREQQLKVRSILLTHTHGDHVADLARVKKETGAPVFVGAEEGFAGAEPFQPGREFRIGELRVSTHRTSGHARGGITFVVHGLARPVAVVGDALFASSMGGGMVSYSEALRTNREALFTLPDETIVCPGHGPVTSIGEEKRHNPFYPEFQKPQ